MIDVPDAARIARGQPGPGPRPLRARRGRPVQTALSTGVADGGHGAVEVRPFRLGGAGDGRAAPERHRGPHRPGPAWSRPAVAAHAARAAPTPGARGPTPCPPTSTWPRSAPWRGPRATPLRRARQPGHRRPRRRPDDQTQVPVGLGARPTATCCSPASPAPGPRPPSLTLVAGRGADHRARRPARVRPRRRAPAGSTCWPASPTSVRSSRPTTASARPALDRLAARRGRAAARPSARPAPPSRGSLVVRRRHRAPSGPSGRSSPAPCSTAFGRVFADGPERRHPHRSSPRTARASTCRPRSARSSASSCCSASATTLDYVDAGLRGRRRCPTFVARAGGRRRAAPGGAGRPARARAGGRGRRGGRPGTRRRAGRRCRSGACRATVPVSLHRRARPGSATAPAWLPIGISEATLGPRRPAALRGRARARGRTGPVGPHQHPGRGRAGRARTPGWRTVVVAGRRSALGRDGAPRPGGRARRAGRPTSARPATGEGPIAPAGRRRRGRRPRRPGRCPAVLDRPDVVVVAAGRADALRGLYSHWTRTVRAGRVGLLLQPDVDLDGDLLSVRLPRRTDHRPRARPGLPVHRAARSSWSRSPRPGGVTPPTSGRTQVYRDASRVLKEPSPGAWPATSQPGHWSTHGPRHDPHHPRGREGLLADEVDHRGRACTEQIDSLDPRGQHALASPPCGTADHANTFRSELAHHLPPAPARPATSWPACSRPSSRSARTSSPPAAADPALLPPTSSRTRATARPRRGGPWSLPDSRVR